MNPRVRALFAVLDARTRGAFSREYDLITRIQALQLERLVALLRHAARHVPFYGRRFAEHGLRASEIKDFGDFERVPTLTKADVVADPDALLSATGARSMLTRKATGSSTGERMVFYRDAAMARNFAHVLRNYTRTGLTLGEPHAFLWGAHFDLKAQ